MTTTRVGWLTGQTWLDNRQTRSDQDLGANGELSLCTQDDFVGWINFKGVNLIHFSVRRKLGEDKEEEQPTVILIPPIIYQERFRNNINHAAVSLTSHHLPSTQRGYGRRGNWWWCWDWHMYRSRRKYMYSLEKYCTLHFVYFCILFLMTLLNNAQGIIFIVCV